MPYETIKDDTRNAAFEMRLWPHQSLPLTGFALFISITALLALVPLSALLGTILLWGILPFIGLTIAGMWWALQRSYSDREIEERLSLNGENVSLLRHNPRGAAAQQWSCNTYWAKVQMHKKGGPVPYYVTLTGSGREVEIGAFLSEDERKALFSDLQGLFSQFRQGRR